MFVLLHIAGGVALIAFAVRLMRRGLDRLFGARLAAWLRRVSENRFVGAGVGVGVAALAPNSTSIALLGVEMVKDGAIRFANLWSIMLGASLGLTILVQLISFNVTSHAAPLLLVGIVLYQGVRHNESRGFGQILLAIGFILIAIGIIKDNAQTIQHSEDFETVMELLRDHPWALAIAAAIMCVLFQSATATLGLLLGLAHGSLLGPDEALPCVVGANIGIGITQIIFGYRHAESRRLGVAMVASRLSVAAIIIYSMPLTMPLLEWISPDSILRQIANAHTGFALLMVVLWLPILPFVSPWIEKIVPEHKNGSDPAKPRYLRRDFSDSPALAFGQSMREILRMAELVRTMMEDFWRALHDRNTELCDDIENRDDIVDSLNTAVKTYLTKLGGGDYGAREADTRIAHLRYAGELETIGDVVDKNLVEMVRKLIRTHGYFSDDGYDDLKEAYQAVMENFAIADTAFATQDADLADQLLRHKRKFSRLDADLREKHFERLHQGLTETIETSSIHLDILTYLKSINSHLTAVAYPILDQAGRPHPHIKES